MTRHPLDRPVWSALTTRQANFAEGSGPALRFLPGTIPFAATRDDEMESLRALDSLVQAGEHLVIAQADPILLPPGLAASISAVAVQMVGREAIAAPEDERIEMLGEADAPQMLALAELTRPGPFSLRSGSLGEFWGIKQGGRLVAMAGERMKLDGMVELSGVCAHPDVRGRGFGRMLSLFVAERIIRRGAVPFLHAYETNTAAIGLYKSIGFEIRSMLNVAMVERR